MGKEISFPFVFLVSSTFLACLQDEGDARAFMLAQPTSESDVQGESCSLLIHLFIGFGHLHSSSPVVSLCEQTRANRSNPVTLLLFSLLDFILSDFIRKERGA